MTGADNQLRILVQLRNKSITLKFKNMISVSSFYKVEKAAHYLIGKEEGIEEGRKKGKEEGKKEGKEEGKEEDKRRIAIRMKEHGLEKEFISLITEMPVEEVEKL